MDLFGEWIEAYTLSVPLDILLVEDNDADARLFLEILSETNKDVRLHRVCNGVEAMAFLKYQPPYLHAPRPHIILLDLNMPKMDGREVLAKVKENPWLKSIPIIVLTTSHAEPDITRSYELLASCYIAKPGELAEFRRLVKSLNDFWLTHVKFKKQTHHTPPAQLAGNLVCAQCENQNNPVTVENGVSVPHAEGKAVLVHNRCMNEWVSKQSEKATAD